MVTVVPEMLHLAQFAVLGSVSAPSYETNVKGVLEKELLIENMQVVPEDMAQLPAYFPVAD